ncbi:MAG TPA: hypothetical protein VH592_09125 [Gemmataceae bacterium]
MRIYRSLPVLAFAALLGFSAGGVQAGRFFGRGSDGSDNAYQYSNRSQDSFGFSPAPQYQARQPHSRHRLFHRDQGVANQGMPANAMSGYGMPSGYGGQFGYMQSPMTESPVNGMPANAMSGYGMPGGQLGYTQTPMVQSPNQTQPFRTTSMAPAQVPVAPVAQSPSCRSCGQAAQAAMSVPSTPVMQAPSTPAMQSPSIPVVQPPSTPAVQSRLVPVPVPAPMPQGPTTAEPPQADVTGRAPF